MTNASKKPDAQSSTLYHLSHRAIEVLDGAGLGALAASIRSDCIARLDEPLYTIAFVGAFNAGKSSLVNALLGRSLLAEGVLPTTAVVTEVIHGTDESFDIHRADGSTQIGRPLSELASVSTSGEAISRVVVRVDSPILAAGVRFVDTPGVQSVFDQHDQITFGYLPVADAVVLCMPASHPLSRRDLELLRDRVLAQDIRKLFFVLGQSDLLSADDVARVEAFVHQELETVVPSPRVFCLSAHAGLEARKAGNTSALGFSGVEPFEAAVRDFLAKEKEAERERRVRRLLEGHLDAAVDALALEKGALNEKASDVATSVAKAQDAIDGSARDGERIRGELLDGIEELKRTARDAIGVAIAGVIQGTVERLQDASLDELKQSAAIEERIREDLQAAIEEATRDLAVQLDELRKRAGIQITTTLAKLRSGALGAVRVEVPRGGLLSIPDEVFMLAEILVLDILLPGGLISALVAKIVGRWLSPRLGDAIGNLLKSLVVGFARSRLIAAVEDGLEQTGGAIASQVRERLGEAGDQLEDAAAARLDQVRRELEDALARAVEARSKSEVEVTRRRAVLDRSITDVEACRAEAAAPAPFLLASPRAA